MTSVKKDLFKKVFHFFSSLFRSRDLFWILFTDIRRSPHFSLRREKEVKKKSRRSSCKKIYTEYLCFLAYFGARWRDFHYDLHLGHQTTRSCRLGPQGDMCDRPQAKRPRDSEFFFHLVFESKGLIFYNCLFSRIRMPNFKR